MPKETMTARERWEAILSRQTPDRVPMSYRATAEVNQMLQRHFRCDTLDEVFARLHADVPIMVEPRYVGPPIDPDADWWGCRYRDIPYGQGEGSYREVVHHPLAQFQSVDEIEANYSWPSVDWNDYSVIPGQVRGKEDRPVWCMGSEPFLIYKMLRGDELAFMDLMINPDIVQYCLNKMYGLCYESTRRIYEQIPGRVTLTWVAEDMGTQDNLLYTPQQIRQYFFPWMKKMMDLAHEAGSRVIHHSDGNIRPIIAELIEIGVDVLDPVQWRCREMEREGLKRDFGDRLIFHGATDNQQTLPFGTPGDVRREVLENLEIFSPGNGYILGPCHNIQPVSPVENILALYETGYEYGWR